MITLISDWRCCCITTHSIFTVMQFWNYAVFQYSWPSVLKAIILVNRCKPRVTCIFHIEKLLILNSWCYDIVHHIFSFEVPCNWGIPMLKFHVQPKRHCTVFPTYVMCQTWESAYIEGRGKLNCVRILQFWRKNMQKLKITYQKNCRIHFMNSSCI
jgi:hypothetical protein